jgi:hypothetical protein
MKGSFTRRCSVRCLDAVHARGDRSLSVELGQYMANDFVSDAEEAVEWEWDDVIAGDVEQGIVCLTPFSS